MDNTFYAKYGQALTVPFALYQASGVDFRTDAVHEAGDTKIMKDQGDEANTANGFTDEGQGYAIVVSGTELEAAKVVIYLVDQTGTKVWLDDTITIYTYGHASAHIKGDLDAPLTLAQIVTGIANSGTSDPLMTTIADDTIRIARGDVKAPLPLVASSAWNFDKAGGTKKVYFCMKKKETDGSFSTEIENDEATIDTDTTAHYDLTSTHTATVGTYACEWEQRDSDESNPRTIQQFEIEIFQDVRNDA